MLNKFKQFLEPRIKSGEVEIQDPDDYIIVFKYKGLFYFFVTEEGDPFYFRLVMPTILKVDAANRERILELINEMNLKYKIAKMTIFEDSTVWLFIEQFVYTDENIDKLFDRVLAIPEKIVEDFKEQNKPNN